ncbi:MAG: YlbF family regulator [Clostridia bacterium]|nr:YlbF family regulator [Clostridia bacterium]
MEILTNEMKEIIAQLGELVKADARHRAIQETIEEYERSEELNAKIAEYNAQQNILADAYSRGEEITDELRDTVQERIDALYNEITSHPVYVAYLNAKQNFDELTNEIFAELQFVITGSRPCSHNCSSCHSDCNHNH